MKPVWLQVVQVFALSVALGWVGGVLSLVYWFQVASEHRPPTLPPLSLSTYLVDQWFFVLGFALTFGCLATPAYFAYCWFKRNHG